MSQIAKPSRKCVVISPVRDEALFLRRTIDSMIAQTVQPSLWIIVDDGSKDETREIVRRAAASHSWIRLHERQDRGTRKVGGGVVEAFKEGLAQVCLEDYDYLCKLDGDLEFQPTYFQRLYEYFEADKHLGTASGKSWMYVRDRLVPERTGDEFSQGQTKLFRVACYKDIGGFVSEVMWDGIDCHRARMTGWQAKSFRDDELRFIHLRPMGSSYKSVFHGRLRWGRGQYFMGTHPLYALCIAGYRMLERPFVLGGLLILAGYIGSFFARRKRYEDSAFRKHLRSWQLAKINPFS